MTGLTHPDSMPATIAACTKRQWEYQNQKKERSSDTMMAGMRQNIYPHLSPLHWTGGPQGHPTDACLLTNRVKVHPCNYVKGKGVERRNSENLWHHQMSGVDVDATPTAHHHDPGEIKLEVNAAESTTNLACGLSIWTSWPRLMLARCSMITSKHPIWSTWWTKSLERVRTNFITIFFSYDLWLWLNTWWAPHLLD